MEQTIYNGQVRIELDHRHRYTVHASGKVHRPPSVTQVLEMLDKPALVQWAANKCGDWLIENEVWSQGWDRDGWENAIDIMRNEFRRVSKRGSDVGGMVHHWVHMYLTSDQPPPMPDNSAACMAIEEFCKWWCSHDIELIESERMIWHPLYEYTGTTDFVLRIDGKRYVVDLKTQNATQRNPKGIYPENHWQTAGYAAAYHHEHCSWDEEPPDLPLTGIIRCGKDGSFSTEWRNAEQVQKDREAFYSLVRAKQATERSVAA